jgi:hypothetical protein
LAGIKRASAAERRRVLDRVIDEVTGKLPTSGQRAQALQRVQEVLRDTPGFRIEMEDEWQGAFLGSLVDAVAEYQDPVSREFNDDLERRSEAAHHLAMRAVDIAGRAMRGTADTPADLKVLAELRDQLAAPTPDSDARLMLAVLREPTATCTPGELVCVEVPHNCTIHDGDAERAEKILAIAKKLGHAWRRMAPSGVSLWLLEQLAELTIDPT